MARVALFPSLLAVSVAPKRRLSGWALTTFLAVCCGLYGCPERPLKQAQTLEKEGQYEKAGDMFLRAAKDSPGNLPAWDGAVRMFCEQEVRVGRCLEVLDLELQVIGNLDRHRNVASQALNRRARARLDQGMVDAAASDLARAEKLGPPLPEVLLTRARIALAQGKQDEAVQALLRAKKLQPDFTEAEVLLRELSEAQDAPLDAFGGP